MPATDSFIGEGLNPTPYAELKAKYDELIFAVSTVFPGESRHETALRYIRVAEDRLAHPSTAQENP